MASRSIFVGDMPASGDGFHNEQHEIDFKEEISPIFSKKGGFHLSNSDGSDAPSSEQRRRRINSHKMKHNKSPPLPRSAQDLYAEITQDESARDYSGLAASHSPTDDSDWVVSGGEEWKVMTDCDDEEEEDTKKLKDTPEALQRKRPSMRKKKSSKKKEWSPLRRRGNKPPRADSAAEPPRTNSRRGLNRARRKKSRAASQTDAAAIAAAMADKHPWRKRRPSNGDDPLASPVVSSPKRPNFTPLDVTPPPPPPRQDKQTENDADASSVASSESGASSSSSSSDSFQSSDKSSFGGLDDDEVVEDDYPQEAFQKLSVADAAGSFPLSFLDPGSFSSAHLDPSLSTQDGDGITRTDANRFALEHRILLRAILQLLTERDHVGVEADVDDPENTIKKGPLKKFSHGGVPGRPSWKVKYVEIRRGSFSYFEDNTRTLETPGRKKIPLRANMCSCTAVDDCKIKGAYGYVLELAVDNAPKRLWMANSEEERQAWMRAIRGATIGGDVDATSQHMDMKLHRDAVEKYAAAEEELSTARNKEEYVACLSLLYGKSLRIPVPWAREHIGLVVDPDTRQSGTSSDMLTTPTATIVKSRVTDLWQRLSRESVSINGHFLNGNCPHGTERIVGALTRCILEHDRLSSTDGTMSELQAIVHARNVLMTYYKSRSKDEAYYAVDSLCKNVNLVVCLPHKTPSQSPLHVQVYSAADEGVACEEEKCGWVTTRSRAPLRWKNRYCIVSEGVLYYYEHCSPTPHGLRGQVVLVGATMDQIALEQDNNLFILKIVSSDGSTERQLCFRNEKDMTLWKEAIQHQMIACSQNGSLRNIASPMTPRQRKMRSKIGKGRIIKGASEMIRSRIPQKLPSFDEKNPNEGTIAPSDSLKSDGTGSKNEPTVQVVVESSRYYKIVTSTPSDMMDEQNTWAMVRANYMHSFLLSGGPQGHLSKGDELVEMEFLEGDVGEEKFEIMFPRAVGA